MGGCHSSRVRRAIMLGDDVNFDHFLILRAIGRGSFGKVCIVQKRDSKRMFAMKYVPKKLCIASCSLSNVLQEVDILTTLEHPFLVNLWFSFQDEEDFFMITDLLMGGDLRFHISRGVRFTEESVKMYIIELALALEYLHNNMIIHRDVKPDNILLDDDGHVHLTDFNIATILLPNQLATAVSGTRPYMAPEIYDCGMGFCGGYSFSVDYWSLGVVAFELLVRSIPYNIRSKTSMEEARAMFRKTVQYPNWISPDMVDCISQLMNRNPRTRISNLQELLQIRLFQQVDTDKILRKECKPAFKPPIDNLNCDLAHELEEMIIEKEPLHKKKKRLAKHRLMRQGQSAPNLTDESRMSDYIPSYRVYNRCQELARRERERRERMWDQELQLAMDASEPPGRNQKQSSSSEAQLNAPSTSGTQVRTRCRLCAPSCSGQQSRNRKQSRNRSRQPAPSCSGQQASGYSAPQAPSCCRQQVPTLVPSYSGQQDPSCSVQQAPSCSRQQDPSCSKQKDPSCSRKQDPCCSRQKDPSCSLQVPCCCGQQTRSRSAPRGSGLKRIRQIKEKIRNMKLDLQPIYSRNDPAVLPPAEDCRQHPRADEVEEPPTSSPKNTDEDNANAIAAFEEKLKDIEYIDKTPSPTETDV